MEKRRRNGKEEHKLENEKSSKIILKKGVYGMARNQNPKLKDVEKKWENFSKGYTHKKNSFKGEPWVPDMIYSHIQGFGIVTDTNGKEYGIVSHNNKGYSKGFMMYLNCGKDGKAIKQDVPVEHYNHPGGLQIVGDYVFVAVENSDNNKSYIRLCDLSKLFINEAPVWIEKEEFIIDMPSHGAAAVAATRYRSKAGEKMLIVPCTPSKLFVYQTNAGDKLPVAESESELLFTQMIEEISTEAAGSIQNISLVTQENEEDEDTVYMFAYISKKKGTSFSDSMELWRFYPDNKKFIKIGESLHIKSSGGGMAGIHFRYGAGLSIKNDDFLFYATQRNFVGGKMGYDTYIKK